MDVQPFSVSSYRDRLMAASREEAGRPAMNNSSKTGGRKRQKLRRRDSRTRKD
jgi:hypothetical protein